MAFALVKLRLSKVYLRRHLFAEDFFTGSLWQNYCMLTLAHFLDVCLTHVLFSLILKVNCCKTKRFQPIKISFHKTKSLIIRDKA